MMRALRAELVKILRRRVLVVAAVATTVFAVGGAVIVLAAAQPQTSATPGRGASLEALGAAGGGTEVFRTAVSFTGFFVFVAFVGAVAVEFGRGTFRTMLVRQPRRLRLLAGKMAALLAFAAGLLAMAEAATWVAARLLAPSFEISTESWTSTAALGEGIADYAAVVAWVSGYAVLGMTLAVLVRSLPIALAAGIAWAGPFEHLVQDAWEPASRLFPGLLLEAFVAGGTSEVTAGRALLTAAVYAAAGAVLAAMTLARRDVVG